MNIHHRSFTDSSSDGEFVKKQDLTNSLFLGISPRYSSASVDMTSTNQKTTASPSMENTATTNQSVFNLVNGILGVGILGFPYAFKMCGIGLASIFVFLIMVVTLYSCEILLVSCQISGKKNYEDLAFFAYGSWGRSCIHFCVLMINLGAMVSYLNVLADVLSSVSGTLIPPGLEPSRTEVLIGITVLAILPIAVFVQDTASLACVSVGSVSIIFIFTLMIILSAMQPLADTTPISYWNTKGAFVAFPVLAYGFTIHCVVFPVLNLLRQSTMPKMRTVVSRATWLCGLIYLSVGAGGYLTFGSRTHGDILRNLGAIDVGNPNSMRWIYERLLKISYGASIVGTVPVVMLPSIALLVPSLDSWHSLSRLWKKRLISVLFIGASFTCAVLIPNVEFILGLNGGTSSILLAYIMPGLIYLKVTGSSEPSIFKIQSTKKFSRAKAWALVIMGVFLGILCTSATLNAVQQEQEVVQLVQSMVDQNKKIEDAEAVEKQTLDVVKAVDVVESATKELGDVRGDTQATLKTLHETAENFEKSENNNETVKEGFWKMLDPRAKGGGNYQTLLKNLEIVTRNLNSTLIGVMSLQEKLKTVAEEIKASNAKAAEVNLEDLSKSGNEHEIKEAKRVNSLINDLGEALGLSQAKFSKIGVAESTLSAVQKRFEMTVKALTETLRIMNHVESVVRSAMVEGKTDDNIKELVSSAMQQAIQATKHSELALELTAKALENAGSSQKSELLSLLSIIIKDYEVKSEQDEVADVKLEEQEIKEHVKTAVNETEDKKSIQKLSKIVTNATESGSGVDKSGDSGQKINTTDVKIALSTAFNIASKTKQDAAVEAKAAAKTADPKIAQKAEEIASEFNTDTRVNEANSKTTVQEAKTQETS
eukprot:g178.t1